MIPYRSFEVQGIHFWGNLSLRQPLWDWVSGSFIFKFLWRRYRINGKRKINTNLLLTEPGEIHWEDGEVLQVILVPTGPPDWRTDFAGSLWRSHNRQMLQTTSPLVKGDTQAGPFKNPNGYHLGLYRVHKVQTPLFGLKNKKIIQQT